MKPKEYLDTYYWYSEKTSEVVRAAALGGIGLAWVFKIDAKTATANTPTLPNGLLFPAALLVVGLGLDVVQYILGTVTWDQEHRRLELEEADPEKDVHHAIALKNRISWCFNAKITLVLTGLAWLVVYLMWRWATT